nr:hypothetical protein GTC16762_33060 [Pigmentibacter ruber]
MDTQRQWNDSKNQKTPIISEKDLKELSKRYSEYSIEKLDALLKTIIVKEVTLAEVEAFLYIAKQSGLCPFKKQIQLIDFKGTKRPYTTIDGFRVLAERSSQYVGQTTPLFCGKDKIWTEVWTENTPPLAAKVGILRKGFLEPIFAIAKYSSYNSDTPTWKKMPDVMLAKCAEALAFRKTFPDNMCGLYTLEEMTQASSEFSNEIESQNTEIKSITPKSKKTEIISDVIEVKTEPEKIVSVPEDVVKAKNSLEKKVQSIDCNEDYEAVYNGCDVHRRKLWDLFRELKIFSEVKNDPKKTVEVSKYFAERCFGVPLNQLQEHLLSLQEEYLNAC